MTRNLSQLFRVFTLFVIAFGFQCKLRISFLQTFFVQFYLVTEQRNDLGRCGEHMIRPEPGLRHLGIKGLGQYFGYLLRALCTYCD
jgi:hypothetical protein